jgi:hypothetical protein
MKFPALKYFKIGLVLFRLFIGQEAKAESEINSLKDSLISELKSF